MTKKEDKAEATKATKHKMLPKGYKMPDGLALQNETPVEYELRGDTKIITGPKGLRPAVLLGSVLSA